MKLNERQQAAYDFLTTNGRRYVREVARAMCTAGAIAESQIYTPIAYKTLKQLVNKGLVAKSKARYGSTYRVVTPLDLAKARLK